MPPSQKRQRSKLAPSETLVEPQPQERAPKRANERAMADLIATRLEEDIVLGRRHPRERLIEQDLCDRFNTHRADVRLESAPAEERQCRGTGAADASFAGPQSGISR